MMIRISSAWFFKSRAFSWSSIVFVLSSLLLPFPGEDFGIDDDSFNPVGDSQRGIPDIPGFFTKNGAKEFLLRRELGFSLGRDFSDEDVPRVHFGPDSNNSALIQILQGLFSDIRDIPVISSFPNFVSRATHSSSSMWMEV